MVLCCAADQKDADNRSYVFRVHLVNLFGEKPRAKYQKLDTCSVAVTGTKTFHYIENDAMKSGGENEMN